MIHDDGAPAGEEAEPGGHIIEHHDIPDRHGANRMWTIFGVVDDKEFLERLIRILKRYVPFANQGVGDAIEVVRREEPGGEELRGDGEEDLVSHGAAPFPRGVAGASFNATPDPEPEARKMFSYQWTWERFSEGPDSTIALLLDDELERICYLLEDQGQPGPKIPGETRIPPGLYRMAVRPDSPKFAHYYERWAWFRGMPWLHDVEGDGEGFEIMGFSFVYLHPGIDDDDSAGCGLTGLEFEPTVDGDYRIKPGTSRLAFEKVCKLVYPIVLDSDDELLIRVTEDRLHEFPSGS